VFVYRNIVRSDAGKDVYTCDDFAQLEGVSPSNGEGYWKFTQATPQGVKFGTTSTGPDDDQTEAAKRFNAWVHRLQQGDNPFTWVVENPQPPYVLDDNGLPMGLQQINGHIYSVQEACPDEDDMIVHDLRPDDANIMTGDPIPTPSPGP
jgi:hypothetical protein